MAEVIVVDNEVSDCTFRGRVQEAVEGENIVLECTETTTPIIKVSSDIYSAKLSF